LVLVAVPLVVALIQYQPWKLVSSAGSSSGVSGNQFLGPAIIGNVSLVVNEAANAGAALDPALVESLREAVESSRSGNHDVAIAKIEAIRTGSTTAGQLPSLLNNLGVEYLSAGRLNQARATFEEALRKDPQNKTAWAGLGQLPADRVAPLRVVNFSSESAGYFNAANVTDENPGTVWQSSDGTLPQSLVLELPVHAQISELSFNNAARGQVNQAAKELEISISDQSATAGFGNPINITLSRGEIGQGVGLKPVRTGRWIKLRILSNYGDPERTQLGDVGVVGKPHPQ
jgi:tetratricopeptide (TPR) repeat protein